MYYKTLYKHIKISQLKSVL